MLVRNIHLDAEELALLNRCNEYLQQDQQTTDISPYGDIGDLNAIFKAMREINANENPKVYDTIDELINFVKLNGGDCNRTYFRKYLKGKKLTVESLPYCSFKFMRQTTKNPLIEQLYNLYVKLDSPYAYERIDV